MTPRASFRSVFLLTALLALVACDGSSPAPTTVQFNGVTYHALGQANLSIQANTLVVENVGASGGDGVRTDVVDGSLDSLGVEIQPLTLGAGARWGLAVFGDVAGQRTALAEAWAEDLGGGVNSIQVAFAAGIGLDQVIFEYFLGGVLVARSPAVPTQGFASTVATAGTTNVGPNSVHAVREGGVVVIGTDYRTDALQSGAAGCASALINVDFQPDPVCADYVRGVPLSATGAPIPAATSAEVTGRAIGRFVVVDGAVQ